jgi:NAD(P)-dependent dehydrogenase (short-subunit alcohol dehydrogenase family)
MTAFGKIDIIVNNAGTSRTGAFEDITDEIWRDDFDQKLFAAIRLTRLVWPQMKERRWGRVINTLNIGAKARARAALRPRSRAPPAGADQGARGRGRAAQRAGQCAAGRLHRGRQHVQAAAKAGIALKDYVATRAKEVPLGRIGRAEEFATIACFLASDAGSYITGTAINVDGGRSPWSSACPWDGIGSGGKLGALSLSTRRGPARQRCTEQCGNRGRRCT